VSGRQGAHLKTPPTIDDSEAVSHVPPIETGFMSPSERWR
jgi:hypothetical protein